MNNFLFLQAQHTEWLDDIIFNSNIIPEESTAFNNLIQQKKDSFQPQAISVMNSLEEKTKSETDIFGYFRRTRVTDSGNIILADFSIQFYLTSLPHFSIDG